jgi:hypothetical protein
VYSPVFRTAIVLLAEFLFSVHRPHPYRGSSTNACHHPTPDSACNTINPTTCNSTNMSPIEAALAAIKLLKPGEKLVYA